MLSHGVAGSMEGERCDNIYSMTKQFMTGRERTACLSRQISQTLMWVCS